MIHTSTFGFLPDGREVLCHTLENQNGMKAKILNFGCVLQSLWIVGREGKLVDIIPGYDSIEGYLTNDASLGALVGRLVGPVPERLLQYGEKTVLLPPNTSDGGHCHGGKKGFSRSLWSSKTLSGHKEDRVVLTLVSPDGDDGYPEEIRVQVVFTLTQDNKLKLDIAAMAEEFTPFNPAFHCYYNLNGHDSGPVDFQKIQVSNTKATINDKLEPVAGTILDLNHATSFEKIFSAHDPLAENGLDHFHLLSGAGMRKVMRGESPQTGCYMEIDTDAPGAIIYSGNWLRDLPGKGGYIYQKHEGFCFEACYVEDNEDFNASHVTLVGPGCPFHRHIIYSFGILK